MRPRKTALPSWSSSHMREGPLLQGAGGRLDLLRAASEAGSTSLDRKKGTGSPSTRVQLPQLSSLSAALWVVAEHTNAGWPCHQTSLINKTIGMHSTVYCDALFFSLNTLNRDQSRSSARHSTQLHRNSPFRFTLLYICAKQNRIALKG